MYFEQLVKTISPKLKAITHRLNGRFTFFNDEDLYQEALMHLWVDFDTCRLKEKTDSYILQGCYFHLKNYIRKVQDKKILVSMDAVIGEEGSDLEDLLPATDPAEYFDYLDSKLLVEKMRNNGLKKKEKAVLALSLEGLTYRQIGEKLGLSHVGVIKMKDNIRERYRKFYEELK